MKRIDVLPDDVLLDIFDFYANDILSCYKDKEDIEAWQTLAHVCRRWRKLVFGSPRRLNLRLCCTPETDPDTLDIWPAFPLIVQCEIDAITDTDNIIAVLGHSNRVREVDFTFLGRKGEEVLAMMQVPFPELTNLWLLSYGEARPVIPDSFLGGSAPRLRIFELNCILFPGLPNLLSTATQLVELWLCNIPHAGYISPEAMVTLLSVSSSLASLCLVFRSSESRPDRETRPQSPPQRSILPALEHFQFEGVAEYLEDLVTLIDTPKLDSLEISFINELDSDMQRLAQFINRTPEFRKSEEAYLQFDDQDTRILSGALQVYIPGREADRQLSSISKFGSFSITSTVQDFYIECGSSHPIWKYDVIESTIWLQLLLPFTAVKNLHLSKEFAPSIASALQELAGNRVTEVLLSLRNIFVEELEPFEKNIGQFIVARHLSGHPVAISGWKKERKARPVEQREDRWRLSHVYV